jgi:hypothetical protein
MINLAKIWQKVSNYSCAQVLFKFNENAKLFLASYFYRYNEADITEDKIVAIVESLLKLFAIMEVVDLGYSSSNFKTFLFGEDVKLVDSSINAESIVADFEKHIKEKWDRDLIKAEILDYDKHMLVYLNEYLLAKEMNTTLLIGDKYDIEHIMPYSGKNLQEIRKDAGIADEEEFRGKVNKLGNKILLEEKINRSIGNEWFRTKVSTSLDNKTGYVDSKYPAAMQLVEKYKNDTKPYWKKEDIDDATEKAAERIVGFIFG